MAPSLDINHTNEDESNNSIVHKPFDEPLSENLFMDVSESECNIVNEISSQSDSSDIPTNVITELNYDDHIESSYSNAVGIYYINWMLHINVHSQHPKHRQQYQQDIMNYLHHEKDIMIYRRNFLQKIMLEWTQKKFVRQYPK